MAALSEKYKVTNSTKTQVTTNNRVYILVWKTVFPSTVFQKANKLPPRIPFLARPLTKREIELNMWGDSLTHPVTHAET